MAGVLVFSNCMPHKKQDLHIAGYGKLLVYLGHPCSGLQFLVAWVDEGYYAVAVSLSFLFS